MSGDRRKFRREGEERRREALIGAALELFAEGGEAAATVRAIAERAGVTPGLIRHYFATKEDLVRQSYAAVMTRMTEESEAAADADAGCDPVGRLLAFVATSLRPPVMDALRVGLWAGFLHQVQRNPEMRAVHEATYLAYRNRLQEMILALPGQGNVASARALAIGCNGVIDGLWMEGGVLPEAFAPGELEFIGLSAVRAILGLPSKDAT